MSGAILELTVLNLFCSGMSGIKNEFIDGLCVDRWRQYVKRDLCSAYVYREVT